MPAVERMSSSGWGTSTSRRSSATSSSCGLSRAIGHSQGASPGASDSNPNERSRLLSVVRIDLDSCLFDPISPTSRKTMSRIAITAPRRHPRRSPCRGSSTGSAGGASSFAGIGLYPNLRWTITPRRVKPSQSTVFSSRVVSKKPPKELPSSPTAEIRKTSTKSKTMVLI